MKKLSVMICCIALFITSIVIESSANSSDINAFMYPDSLDELISAEPDIQHILHYYNGTFVYWIGQGKTLEELISLDSKECAIESLLAYYCDNPKYEGGVTVRYEDGQYEAIGNSKGNIFFASEIEENKLLKSQIKQEFRIANIVCLSEEASYGAILIYYVTDIGDYVLFKETAESDDVYLFPLAAFRSFAAEYYEWLFSKQTVDENGNTKKATEDGPSDIKSVFGIDRYLIANKTNAYRNFPVVILSIIIVIIAVILTVALFAIRHKKAQ